MFCMVRVLHLRVSTILSFSSQVCSWLHYRLRAEKAGLFRDRRTFHDSVFWLRYLAQEVVFYLALSFFRGCGRLSVIGPHNLIGSDTIRSCGFVKLDMALLEKVCHCEGGL